MQEENSIPHADITIRKAQQLVDDWIRTYGVRYFSELTNMAVLTEEVGELARVISRKYGDQSFKPGEPQDPADEMADARQFGPKMWYNTHQSFQMEVKNGIYGRAGSLYWQNMVQFALGYASY